MNYQIIKNHIKEDNKNLLKFINEKEIKWLNKHFAFINAFASSLSVRRSVRSTSATSRRDAERARFKVQGPNLASKAFLSQKA